MVSGGLGGVLVWPRCLSTSMSLTCKKSFGGTFVLYISKDTLRIWDSVCARAQAFFYFKVVSLCSPVDL